MAVIIELKHRVGEFRVVSDSGNVIGYVQGSGAEWVWSIEGGEEIVETSAVGAFRAIASRLPEIFASGGSNARSLMSRYLHS